MHLLHRKPYKNESLGNPNKDDSASNELTKIVGSELNRVDLIMRFFDKTTEFSGKSRRKIYTDYWKQKEETIIKKIYFFQCFLTFKTSKEVP